MKAKKRIYLDYAAATPLSAEVRRAMAPFETKNFGNPSALYKEGVIAQRAIVTARRKISEGLFAHPDEIIFTGSGTEGNNLALMGVVRAFREADPRITPHIIVSVIEHPSILAICDALMREGVSVTYVPVNELGIVSVSEIQKALKKETILVSVMYANNEIGTIQPIREIAKMVRLWRKKNGSAYPYIHTDACQAVNYLDLHVERLGIDLMTINSSKIYGPKGTGALYVRRRTAITSIILGGGQEHGMRGGTENVSGIVGLAEAFYIARAMREKESKRLTVLRDHFIRALLKKVPNALLNGSAGARLPNNVNISIPEVESEHLIIELDAKGVAASAKSACKSMDEEISHVIIALGRKAVETESGVRFTLGRDTTKKEIDYTIAVLPQLINKLKNTSRL